MAVDRFIHERSLNQCGIIKQFPVFDVFLHLVNTPEMLELQLLYQRHSALHFIVPFQVMKEEDVFFGALAEIAESVGQGGSHESVRKIAFHGPAGRVSATLDADSSPVSWKIHEPIRVEIDVPHPIEINIVMVIVSKGRHQCGMPDGIVGIGLP